jgi:ribosomal-protein-serine acetyltransferase
VKSPLPSRVRTDRLFLRHWEPSDAEALTTAISDSLEHLRPWLVWAWDEPVPLEKRLEYIDGFRRDWVDGERSVLGIFRDNVVVGNAGVRAAESKSVELGYWIHADHIGAGFATEAIEGLITASFELPWVNAAEIRHDEANMASARVPEKLGFAIRETSYREPSAPSGSGVQVHWVLSREAWLDRRRQL